MSAPYMEIPEADIMLGEELGRGAFGIVRRATVKGRLACAKSLHMTENPALYCMEEGSAEHARTLADFHAEIGNLSLLHNTNIVSIEGVVCDAKGRPKYIILELAFGNLKGFARSLARPLTLRELKGIARDILNGLAYLHAQGLIHRDIKPENLLVFILGEGFLCKLGDIGLARVVPSAAHSMTSGAGSVYYMAPEAMTSGSYGVKADMFALGITLAEVVCTHMGGIHCSGDVSSRFQMAEAAVGYLAPLCPALAEVIKACVAPDAPSRPTAAQALAVVDGIVITAPGAPAPIFISSPVAPASPTTRLDAEAVLAAMQSVGISEDVVDGIVDEVLDGVCTSAEALVTSLRARGVPGRKALAVKAALASPIASPGRGDVDASVLAADVRAAEAQQAWREAESARREVEAKLAAIERAREEEEAKAKSADAARRLAVDEATRKEAEARAAEAGVKLAAAERARAEEEEKKRAAEARVTAAEREESALKEAAARAAVTVDLSGSAILASVAPERVAAFLRELSGWLPRRTYKLLYGGIRDGMTASTFHRLCDGKGPTLVLVRCDKGWVFGGHAGTSWKSPPRGSKTSGSGDSFLFSVTGPYTSAPVRLPVKADEADKALSCHAGYGPWFNGGLSVNAGSGSPTDSFYMRGSRCRIDEACSPFLDVVGKGNASLTGAEYFTPVDIEVYAITLV